MRSNQNSPKKPAAPAAKSVPTKPTPNRVKSTTKDPVPANSRKMGPAKPALPKQASEPPSKKAPARPVPIPPKTAVASGEAKPARPSLPPAKPKPTPIIPPKIAVANEAKPARPSLPPAKNTTVPVTKVAPIPAKKTPQTGKPNPSVPTTPTRAQTAPKRSMPQNDERITNDEKITEPEPEDIEPVSEAENQADDEKTISPPQPNKKSSSNKIHWKEVVKNVFQFYFCLCLPDQP